MFHSNRIKSNPELALYRECACPPVHTPAMGSPSGTPALLTELCEVIQLNAHGLNDTIFQNGWRAGKKKDLHFLSLATY